jgi:pyridoxine 5'-phosphate synthase PdxJ
LLNDPATASKDDFSSLISRAYVIALCRAPSVSEINAAKAFISSGLAEGPEQAVADFCQALISTNEFSYLN